MDSPDRLGWVWTIPDVNHDGAAGNLAKLFRNEPDKQPGALSVGAPSSTATVLAREAIQNSWDAAQDLRRDLMKESIKAERSGRRGTGLRFAAPPFEVRFCFRTVRNGAKDSLVRNLALDQLARRLAGGVARDAVGLGEEDCLSVLSDADAEIPYLVIEEQAASGMYGPWHRDRSKMYQALVAIGFTTGDTGRGGSYGFGKAGLIRGSATRTLVAYTCFRERDDEPGVTRRLLGVTYWNHYSYRDESYTGFARFGNRIKGVGTGSDVVVPFINEQADAVAARLGLELRAPDDCSQLGTTFILIEPQLSPEDLVTAIERSWWPALEDPSLQFGAVVYTSTGEALHPRPRRDPVLRTFVEAYEVATSPGPNAAYSRRTTLRSRSGDLGLLGLVSDVEGWSYAEQTGDPGQAGVDHRSLVALMRKPRMVVEYLTVGRRNQPYIRGVFVADPSINDDLRDTEPKGHDAWDWKAGDARPEARSVARKIHNGITTAVRQFKKALSPPARPPEDLELPVFDRMMKRLLSGDSGRRVVPPVDVRPVSIGTNTRLESVGEDSVRVRGKAVVGLSEHHMGSEAPCAVSVRYRFVENDAAGDWVHIEVTPPNGFTRVDGKYVGKLCRSNRAVFKFTTVPYRSDWSGRLIVDADLLDQSERRQT